MDQIDLDGEFLQDPLKQQPAQDPAAPTLNAAAEQPLWAQIERATELKQKADFNREFNPSPRRLQEQALASFQAASERDPDLVAKAQQHARAIGAPLDGAEKNIEVLRSMARVREFADRRLAERNPTLARWLGNIDYAAVASDDVESLQQIDDWFSRVGRQYMSGRQQTELGYLGEDIKNREGGMPTAVERYRIDALQSAIGRAQGEADWTTALFNPIGQMSKTAPAAMAAGWAAAKAAGSVAGPKAAAWSGSIAAGVATFESSRRVEGGTFYLDLIDRGVPPEIARSMSDMHGVVAGALEAIGGPGFMLAPVRKMIVDAAVEKATGLLLKSTRREAWMRFGKSSLKSTLGEVSTEVSQTLSENIFTAMAMELKGKQLDQPLKPEEMVKLTDGLGETIYATMQSMLPLGSVLPGVRVFRDLQGIRKAAGERAWWDGLSDRVANSKLKARAPQAFADLIEKQVEEKGAPETVLIDRRMARAVLRAADAAAVADAAGAGGLNEREASRLQGARGKASQELADALGEEVLAQIENDSPLNDTIEVPFSAYAAKVVGTKLHEILRNHIKMDPNGYTLFEANILSEQARDELQAAKQTIREQGEKQAEWEEERQTVEASVRTHLRNSGVRGMTTTNARLSAQVVAATVVQSARRAGMTPVEYWNAHGFRILSEALDPASVEQALAGKMEPFIGKLEAAGRAPSTSTSVVVESAPDFTMVSEAETAEGQAAPAQARRPAQVTQDYFAEEGAFFRVVVGEAAFQDMVTSGAVRTNAESKTAGESLASKLAARPTAWPSFSKNAAAMAYAGEHQDHFIIITRDESMSVSKRGRHGSGTTYFPGDAEGNPVKSLDASKVAVYRHLGEGRYELVWDGGPVQAQAQQQAAPAEQQATQPVPPNVTGQLDSLQQVLAHYETTLGDPVLARAAEQVLTEMVGPEGLAALRRGELPAGFNPEQPRQLVDEAILAIEDAALRERTAELEEDERTDDIFEQTVTLRQQQKRDNPQRWGLTPGRTHSTREVAAALQARQRIKYGEIALNDFSDEAARKISGWMAEEVEFEASAPQSAIGWYSQRFRAAMDRLGAVFPELRTDQDARSLMTALIAVTSDGQKVAPNLLMASHIYARYRSGGATPGKLTSVRGHNRGSIPGNLEVLQAMLDSMGVAGAMQFLMREGEVRELRDIAAAYPQAVEFSSAYKVDTVVPLAAMFLGPKLGMFFANLMGSSGYLTMDLWWSRTFNRYRGNLLLTARQSGLDKLAALLGDPSLSQEQVLSEALRLQKLYQKAKFKSDLVKMMGSQQPDTKVAAAAWMEQAKLLAGEAWDAMLLQHQLYRAANTVAKAVQGTRDQPRNASERAFMIKAAKLAQRKLKRRGLDLTIADIQAALWYYEKRLYAELGARGTQDISYEEAAGRVVDFAADPSRPDGLGGLAAALDPEERQRAERKREAQEGGALPDLADGTDDQEGSYLGDDEPGDDPGSSSQLRYYERQFDSGSYPDFAGWDDLGELAQDEVESESEQAAAAEEGPVRVLIDLTATIEGAETERLQIGKLKVNSMQDLAEAAAHLALQAREQMQGIVTDDKGKVLGVIGAARGTTSMALADKGMLLDLMMFPKARNVWWVHNHPSGDSSLSDEDIQVARSMSAVLSSTPVFSRGIMAIGAPTDGSSTWQFYEVHYGKKDNGTVQAPDRSKKYKTTRLLERRLLDVRPGKPVTNSAELTQYLRDTPAEGKDAIVLFDVRMRPVGVLGIDGYAWDEMRKDGRMHTLMTYLARANVERATLVRVTSTHSGTNNLSWALGSLGINVIVPHNWDAATRSVSLDHNFTAVKRRVDIFAQDDVDYRGSHRAPTSHSGVRIDRLDELYPDDIYGPADRAARYYGHGDSALDSAAIAALQALRGRPDATVRVYRAVPQGVEKINTGDWVTVTRAYAEQHGQGFSVPWHIVEMDVPAKALWMSGDSIHEQGYDPDERVDVLAQDDDAPPPRERRTLYAQKNIQWDRVTMNRLVGEGLPAPSIGVASIRAPYLDFGNVTLIGKPDLVNPTKVPVFDADAWTVPPDVVHRNFDPPIDPGSWEAGVGDRFAELLASEGRAKGAWPGMVTGFLNHSESVRRGTATVLSLRSSPTWSLQAALLDDEARTRRASQIKRAESGQQPTWRSDYVAMAIDFAAHLPLFQPSMDSRWKMHPGAAYLARSQYVGYGATAEWVLAAVQGGPTLQRGDESYLVDEPVSLGITAEESASRKQLIASAPALLREIVANINPGVMEQIRQWAWDHKQLWTHGLVAKNDDSWTDELQAHAARAGWTSDPAISRFGEFVAQVMQMIDENALAKAIDAGSAAWVVAGAELSSDPEKMRSSALAKHARHMRLDRPDNALSVADSKFWKTTEGVVGLATALTTLQMHVSGSQRGMWELLGAEGVVSPTRSTFEPVVSYSPDNMSDQQEADAQAFAIMHRDIVESLNAAHDRLGLAYLDRETVTMVRMPDGRIEPANAANIAASIGAKGRINAPDVASVGTVRARLAQRFDSWEQMIAAADRIVNNDRHYEDVVQFQKALERVTEVVLQAQVAQVYEWLSDPDKRNQLARRITDNFPRYAAMTDAERAKAAAEFLRSHARAVAGGGLKPREIVFMLVDKVLTELPFDQQENASVISKMLTPFTTTEHVSKLVRETTLAAVPAKAKAKIAAALRDMVRAARVVRPDYWEAKPQRMVKLEEFAAVVLPESWTSRDVARFASVARSKGLQVFTYDDVTGLHQDRRDNRVRAIREAVRSLDAEGVQVLFQDEDAPPSGDPLAPGRPGFFSATEQWIMQSPKEEMTVAQWQQHISTAVNKGWIRKAELEWLEVPRILDEAAPKQMASKVKLTREDLLKQLDLVDVATVYHGMTRPPYDGGPPGLTREQQQARLQKLVEDLPKAADVLPHPRDMNDVRGVYLAPGTATDAEGRNSRIPDYSSTPDNPDNRRVSIVFDSQDLAWAQVTDDPSLYQVALPVTALTLETRAPVLGFPVVPLAVGQAVLYVDIRYDRFASEELSARNIENVRVGLSDASPVRQALNREEVRDLLSPEFAQLVAQNIRVARSSIPDRDAVRRNGVVRTQVQHTERRLGGFAEDVSAPYLLSNLEHLRRQYAELTLDATGYGLDIQSVRRIETEIIPDIDDAIRRMADWGVQPPDQANYDRGHAVHDYDKTPGPAEKPWNLILRWMTPKVDQRWTGHWEFTNPLVHIRGDRRVSADAQRTPMLYVHEVQSDWAQSAQRHGMSGYEKDDLSRGLALEWLLGEYPLKHQWQEEWGHLHAMLEREHGEKTYYGFGFVDQLAAASTSEEVDASAREALQFLKAPKLSSRVTPEDRQRITKDVQAFAKARKQDLQHGTLEFDRLHAQLLAEQKAVVARQANAEGDSYTLAEGPFVASNDAAIELGVKRAIMAAVAENLDAVAFGTAETQEMKARQLGGSDMAPKVELLPMLVPGEKPNHYKFESYEHTEKDGWIVAVTFGDTTSFMTVQEFAARDDVSAGQAENLKQYVAFAGKRILRALRTADEYGIAQKALGEMTPEMWSQSSHHPFVVPFPGGPVRIHITDPDRAVTYRRVEAAAKRMAQRLGGAFSRRPIRVGAVRVMDPENRRDLKFVESMEQTLQRIADAGQGVLKAAREMLQRAGGATATSTPQDLQALDAESEALRLAYENSVAQGYFRAFRVGYSAHETFTAAVTTLRWGLQDAMDRVARLIQTRPLGKFKMGGVSPSLQIPENGIVPQEAAEVHAAFGELADQWAGIADLGDESLALLDVQMVEDITVNVPVIELTPAMRAAADRGIPLWSSEGSRGRRGAFLPKLMTMLLFRKADLTTTLHELSHWYLVDLLQSAKDPNAPAQVRAEVSAILEWMGVGTVEEFEALSRNQQIQLHERWAYMFEAWLSHGDAPSLELRDAFAAIRGWMRDVYGDTVLEMNDRYKRKFGQDLPGLDPKVRQLFARMMASDQELAEMEMVREAMPLYSTQEESGMDDVRWAEYQQRVREAQAAAQSRMDKAAMKEVQLVNGARAKVIKAIEAEADKLRGRIAAEVRADLSGQPVYRLLTYLATGRYSDDPTEGQVTRYQIDHDRAKELVGEDVWKELIQRYGYGAGKVFGSGRDPEELASEFGFTSGQAMLEELRRAPTLDTAVQDATNERMLKQHSEFMDPDKKEDMISAALNSEARERLVAFEVGVLADAARRVADQVTGAANVGTAAEQRLDALRADLAAARQQVRQIEQERTQSDEERAARQRLEAIRSELAALRQQDETPDGLQRIEGLVAERRALNQRIEGMLPENARAAQDRVRELETLQRQAQRIAAGPITSERLLAAAAQEAAREVVDTTPVRELRRLRQRAEQSAMSAARRAREAQRKGDVFGALEAGRDRLRAFAIARQAGQALEEVERGKKAVKRLWQQRDDEITAKRRDVDVVLAARALAAAYRMGTAVRNERDYMANLRKYNPERAAEFEDMLAAARQRGGDYRSMSMRDLRQVWRQIESLWEQSRRDQLAVIAGRQVEQSVLTSQLAGDLQKLGPKDPKAVRSQATSRTTIAKHISSIKAWLRRVESWARSVGPAWQRYIYRPVQERVTAYRLKSSAEVRIYEQALRQIVPTLRRGKIEWQGYWTFGAGNGGQGMLEVLGALLHCGNDSNYRKLLLGYGWGEERADGSLDDLKFREFLQKLWDDGDLRQEHLDWVQGVWDQLERLKPEAQEAHRQVFGTYFEEVPARAFEGPWGSLRGGYVPAKVDRNFADPGMQRYDNMEELRTDFRSSMPATASGFRHSRVEAYTKRLSLDPSMVARHIDEQVRFSMLQPVIQQTLRLINSREVTDLLGQVDPSAKELMLIPWLTRVANQSTTRRSALPAWDRFWSAVTRNAVLSTMFGNVSVALQNVANFFPALTAVPAPHMARAFASYWRNPMQATRDVRAASDYMRAKVEANMHRMVARIRSLETGQGLAGRALTEAQVHSQFLSQATQTWGEVIVWNAAYNHFLSQRRGWADESELHREAVAHADGVVRETQGANDPESVAAYATGTPFMKSMLVFSGYFNTMANLNATNFAKLFREMGWRAVYSPRTAMAWFLGMAAPMFVGEAIARMLSGTWEDEEDDDWTDPVLRAFGWSQFSFVASSLPGVGPGLRGIAAGLDDAPWNDRIDVSPVVSALTKATVGLAKSIRRIGEGEEWTFRNLHDVATAMTVWSGVPLSAATRTARLLGADE